MDEKNLNKQENVENATQGVENESNAAKRIRLLGIDDGEKIHDSGAVIQKGNFFSNFWYQHKWGFIIGTVLVIIGIFFIISMVTQPSYDMYLSYAGPLYPDYDTRTAIEGAFKELSKDYDGDGEKTINFAAITYQNDEQRQQTADEMQSSYGTVLHTSENYKALNTIQTQMLSGTVAIYLMDEALYKEYEAGMVAIKDILGYELDDRIMAGVGGVYFKKTDFFYHMYATEQGRALNNLPNDTVLCILPQLVTIDEELYGDSMELYKAILEFEIAE